MVDLELSQDNKFAAAYTNNNEIVLLNTLVSEFVKIQNPFKEDSKRSSKGEVTQVEEYNIKTDIQGLVLLEGRLVVYSNKKWIVYDMAGNKVEEGQNPEPMSILKMQMISMEHFSIISYSGFDDDDSSGIKLSPIIIVIWNTMIIVGLQTYFGKFSNFVSCHGAVAINKSQKCAFLCDDNSNFTVSRFEFSDGIWEREMMFRYLIIWD